MNPPRHLSLNLNIRGLGPSATLAIKDRCWALRQAGKKVYDFGLGQSPFPVPLPMVEALRLAAPEKDYLPVAGLPALREAVAEFHRKKDQLDAHPDRILVGPGSKELMFLLQLTYYGEILLPTPAWVSYLPQAKIIGRRISLIHSSYDEGFLLSADRLRRSLELVNDDGRPRLLVLNYPSNPTGATYDEAELRAIADIARRFSIIVLSDEIYGQLRFDAQHLSISRYYPEGTIVSSGISKWCGAGGWRLGTFSFPPDLQPLAQAMAAVASETYTSVSAPIQYAAIHAFHGSADLEQYLAHARRILAALGRRCHQILLDAGLRLVAPRGAFYLFPDYSPHAAALHNRGITDGQTLCDRLLEETGVAILPGSAFGRPRGELTARLSYVDFDGPAALTASMQTSLDAPLPDGFIEHYCSRCIEGVQRIAEWTQSAPRGAPRKLARA
jgi:aspartate aminotransferase